MNGLKKNVATTYLLVFTQLLKLERLFISYEPTRTKEGMR